MSQIYFFKESRLIVDIYIALSSTFEIYSNERISIIKIDTSVISSDHTVRS